jgi:CDP-diacylglycerol--glycerol-3-phosphate 3-phosphatidyltransferase/cardiolipin synthase
MRGRSNWALALPNVVTLLCLPLAALLWVFPRSALWVLTIVALAALTDLLDGWLARRRRKLLWAEGDPGAWAASVTRGEVLDGFVDKVFAVSVFALVIVIASPPWLPMLATLAREVAFVPMMLAYRLLPAERRARIDFTAGKLGKVTTVAQTLALGLAYVGHAALAPVAYVTGALGLAASVHYAVRAYRASRASTENGK